MEHLENRLMTFGVRYTIIRCTAVRLHAVHRYNSNTSSLHSISLFFCGGEPSERVVQWALGTTINETGLATNQYYLTRAIVIYLSPRYKWFHYNNARTVGPAAGTGDRGYIEKCPVCYKSAIWCVLSAQILTRF